MSTMTWESSCGVCTHAYGPYSASHKDVRTTKTSKTFHIQSSPQQKDHPAATILIMWKNLRLVAMPAAAMPPA